MLDVSISIVNYESRNDLETCLDSLVLSAPALRCKAWVVDNASLEPIGDLAAKYPDVKFILNNENKGFGSANNQVIREASSRYHFIVNPDVIFRKGAIEQMASFMDSHKDVGVVGPKVYGPDGSIQETCRRFPTVATFFMRGLFPHSKSRVLARYMYADLDHGKTADVDWVLGSCMFFRKDVLDGLGGFDENFFMYYEDIDLCYRTKRAGHRVVYYPDACVTHTYRRESAKKIVSKIKMAHALSAFRFFAKHLGERGWSTVL